MFPITFGAVLQYEVCRLYCVDLGTISKPTFDLREVFFFTDMSHYSVDDVHVSIWLTVTSLSWCTKFVYTNFRLCQCCCALVIVSNRRDMGHFVDKSYVLYTAYVDVNCVLLYVFKAACFCYICLKIIFRLPRYHFRMRLPFVWHWRLVQ